MKALVLLTLAAVLLFSGCVATSEKNFELPSLSTGSTETPEISNTPVQSSKLIDSLIDNMQLDKAKDSVAGYTCESTFEDILDKAEGKINTVFLTYYSELVGYPAVATYVFRNTDDAVNTDAGNPPLCLMTFEIIQDKNNNEQLNEIVSSMDAVLGEHSTDEEPGFYKWENESYHISLSTDSSVAAEPIVRVFAYAPPETDLTSLFPYAFGTDIKTVYHNETPAPLPESYTISPYSYHLIYDDGGTRFAYFFAVRESELKLSSAEFHTDLYDIETEDIGNCLQSFGNRMEEILGSADSRSIMSYNTRPSLYMEWPGLEIKAYQYLSDENYSIFINFSEDYFIRNEAQKKSCVMAETG